MADGTKIEWTDATWNPITGCAVVSPGCTNCYAMKLAGTRLKHHPSREGLTKDSKAGPVWTGEVRFNREWLDQPLRWTKPRMIFVCAHGDLFAEGVPDEWIDQIFAVMALAPQHTFQVLTKRPERMRDYLTTSRLEYRLSAAQIRLEIPPSTPGRWPHMPLPNVWLGTSSEDQIRYASRWPFMEELQELGWLTWLSAEPLIGPLNLRVTRLRQVGPDGRVHRSRLPQWVVAGGESGPGARPMHPDWARQLRDQCSAAGVPFLFKQWGAWAPSTQDEAAGNPRSGWCAVSGRRPAKRAELYPEAGAAFVANVGKKAAGRLLDGIEHNGFPEVRR
ncbi:phage Gp37/Gp68 family protein [Sinorhizobium sp. CCBAU 05631]|uniref:DUF5131 family protein n=1 Tax=Sinorhizobium sp. CCBAU 05631 TaxID=794846 RepID=UPI0004B9B31F|nr:phage Gp37/Gp68 family protein [Sinorhizobium sp. CCBAU 05631]ASY56446.1 Phage protein [Sinorhizobium sp. CCBAU 05631]